MVVVGGVIHVQNWRNTRLHPEPPANHPGQIFTWGTVPGAGLDKRNELLSQTGGVERHGREGEEAGVKTKERPRSLPPTKKNEVAYRHARQQE